MRVLVELFDKEPIENVLGACIFEPEIVVYLCDRRDASFAKEQAVYRLFKRRRLKTRPRFYYLNTTSPNEIRRTLHAVASDYPGCVFDFTGGRDLVLLVAGAFCETYGLPGFFIDLPGKQFIDVRGCAHLEVRFAMPAFLAEDIFAMTGATIHGHGHFPPGQMDAAFRQDVHAAWEIVARNTRAWGEFVGWLQAACSGTSASTLDITAPVLLQGARSAARVQPGILENLHAAGLLTKCRRQNDKVTFRFKSPLHRKCLLNQGIWLELYCYLCALDTGRFDDVRTSIVVDWDGVQGGANNTKNEIDVFLAKDAAPAFVSCKMSAPTPLALSEIRLLSAKFGGEGSITVLLTAAKLGGAHKALRLRASDLGIALLDSEALQDGRLGQHLADLF